ncbi:MAG: phosphoribosylanthranilate isomerase [bacterium]
MKYFKVKVCGITRPQDGLLAAELGADMIGLIFARRSPRCVSLPQARKIVSQLPALTQRVGVFVNTPVETMVIRAKQLRLDWVQLHGEESGGVIRSCQKSGLKVIKAFSVGDGFRWPALQTCPAELVLVDNAGGGSGRAFDWSKSPGRPAPNLVLAGGISADNLEEGIGRFEPTVVDVNTSVESKPGVKSPKKLRDFMKKCHQLRGRCY